MIWFLSWVVWVEKKWSLLWCPDHVPQSYPVTFGGNPMMLDLKNVCLLFLPQWQKQQTGTRELYHGVVVSFQMLFYCYALYQKDVLSGLYQGESEQRISPEFWWAPTLGVVISMEKFWLNTSFVKTENLLTCGTLLSEIAGPRSSCWKFTHQKKGPRKRNLWSSKQSTQNLYEKSRFVVSHPAPPILLHRFVKGLMAQLPKGGDLLVFGVMINQD